MGETPRLVANEQLVHKTCTEWKVCIVTLPEWLTGSPAIYHHMMK